MRSDTPTYENQAAPHPTGATPLDAYLASIERAESFQVERVLKTSAFETTEVVRFEGARGGSLGPYVRKRIDCSAGVGHAYEALWEAQRAGLLLCGVPRLVDCVRQGDELVVVMEFIEGPTLANLVEREGPSVELAVRLVPAVARTVSELHERLEQPLIHRDLKPTNIIVRGGAPVVIDFGIARRYRPDAEADTVHFGTRPFAPPEQFGFGQTDVRSDVYALGKLLLWCAAGEAALTMGADDLYRVLPRPLVDVALRACALDPSQRYASAREVATAIEAACCPQTAREGGAAGSRGRAEAGDSGRAASEPGSPVRRIAVPSTLGRVWNALVLACYALVAVSCVLAAFSPNEEDASLPLWFRVVEYLVMGHTLTAALAISLLDMRRLRERYAVVRRLCEIGRFRLAAAAAAVSVALTVILGAAAGVV